MSEENGRTQTTGTPRVHWENDFKTALEIWLGVGSKLEELLYEPVPEDSSCRDLAALTEQLYDLVTAIGNRKREAKGDDPPEGDCPDNGAPPMDRQDQEPLDRAHGVAIPDECYFATGQVSELLDVEPYVLRWWVTEFKGFSAMARNPRLRRGLYHKKDLERLALIRRFLYDDKFTVPGAKKRLHEFDEEERRRKEAASEAKKVEAMDTLDVVSPKNKPDESPSEGAYGIKFPDKSFLVTREVSEMLQVRARVLRHWISEFKGFTPTATRPRARRYTKKDVERLALIRHLLDDEKFTISGAKERVRWIDKYERRRTKVSSRSKKASTSYSPNLLSDRSNG